jgi:hypothetical protein
VALNIDPRSADFVPYVKWNGKAGRWYMKNEAGQEIEVVDMTAIFDLAHIKLGWVLFAEGQAPDHVWDNGKPGPAPSEKHRRGFAVRCFSPNNIGGLREFVACSNVSVTAIKDLYELEFEDKPQARQGLVPVVTCEKVVPIKSKFGTNYQPVFKIQRWVDRPAALDTAPATIPPTRPPTDAALHDRLDEHLRGEQPPYDDAPPADEDAYGAPCANY